MKTAAVCFGKKVEEQFFVWGLTGKIWGVIMYLFNKYIKYN